MFGDEAIRVSELLDITPTMARRLLILRDKLRTEDNPDDNTVVTLNPDRGIDRRIIDAFGWKDNGQGGMGDREWLVKLPPRLPLTPARPIPTAPPLVHKTQ